jgi:hypothetical protein
MNDFSLSKIGKACGFCIFCTLEKIVKGLLQGANKVSGVNESEGGAREAREERGRSEGRVREERGKNKGRAREERRGRERKNVQGINYHHSKEVSAASLVKNIRAIGPEFSSGNSADAYLFLW